MRYCLLTILLIFALGLSFGQTIGGSTVYGFLKLSGSPQLTALGGLNISNQSNDVSIATMTPSLLRNEMHTQTSFSFNSFYGGIKNFHFTGAYHAEKIKTNFGVGVNYYRYGSITETDPSGNILGNLRASDYVIQLMASRQYLNHWYYGSAIKFIRSDYGLYKSSGIALDLGLSYLDTANLFQASLAIVNMGTQLTRYAGTSRQDLPFDVQLGVSKRLAKAPIQFSLTLHHLHQFDIVYHDTAFNNDNDFVNPPDNKITFDKIFRHVVLATQVYVSDKIELSAGYNYLRRKELNVGTTGNGLNGFSMGVGVLFKKLQLRYARSYYQNNSSFHQLGINLKLNEYFGLGKIGEKINW